MEFPGKIRLINQIYKNFTFTIHNISVAIYSNNYSMQIHVAIYSNNYSMQIHVKEQIKYFTI